MTAPPDPFLHGVRILTAAIVSQAAVARLNTPARVRIHSPRPLSIAHRGDSAAAPENTLPAFTSALRAGADMVELDYHETADEALVALHDALLDRTTDVAGRFAHRPRDVAAWTMDELRQLDAGSWFHTEFTGTRIPSLEEALREIYIGSACVIEHKTGRPDRCIELLRRCELLDHVVLQSFDWNYLRGCRQLAPDLVSAALGDGPATTTQLDELLDTGSEIVGWNEQYLNERLIAEIHARGLKAWCYTVDDPARAEQLLRAGLDGLITNYPGRMRALLDNQHA